MRRSDWEHRSQDWWQSGPRSEWRYPGPGQAAWQGFGKRIFFGLIVVGGLMMLALVLLGVLLAFVLGPGVLAVVVAPVALALVAGLAARWAFRTWRPVRELIRAAGSLADGDYSSRVSGEGSASIRPVASSFNEMAERLEAAEAQRRRLLADLGHELRTPLTVIRGEVEAMLDGVHQPDPRHLELLIDEVEVMERLLEDLRTLSLAEAGTLALHLEPTDLNELVGDVAESYRRAAAEDGVEIVVWADESVPELVVDPVRIREVVTNLAVNSLRAMPQGGALTISTRAESTEVIVEVADTGHGITADELTKVFNRFHRGVNSPGTGLGLTISRDLVRSHGGSLTLESAPGDGTRAIVTLPLQAARRG